MFKWYIDSRAIFIYKRKAEDLMEFSTKKRTSNNKKNKSYSPLIYFFLSILYLEGILKLSTLGFSFSPTIILSTIFALFFAIIFTMLVGLFPRNVNHRVTMGLLFLLTSLFISQLIYYKIFKTFYTVYSASNAGQVLQFWKEVTLTMRSNLILVILLLLPFIIYVFIGRKLIDTRKLEVIHLIVFFLGLLILFSLAFLGLRFGKSEENSAYNLYYNIHSPNYSVNKLGLLTYMRLDVQRNISDWSPKFVGELPEPGPEVNPPKDKGEEVPDPEEEEPEYNIMNIDFDKLILEEKNEGILEMHKYFSSISPTEKNEYTGRFKDYNLILITAEGFSHLAVDKEVTPTLYKMVHEGFHFKNFYTPIWGVSTSDGEYVANTGLIPKSGVWSFRESSKIYMPFVMGNQFKKLGYSTRAYHNHTYTFYDRHLSHPNMGYDYKGLGNGLDVKASWPESDLEMVEVTIPEYINDRPFHVNYMTVSGHMLYTFEGNYIAYKNRSLVDHLDYSTNAQAYLASQIELDRALEYLLDQLDKEGLADNTLIALSADHYPYGLEVKEMEELAGKSIEENFELYRNAFILYTSNMEPEVIDKPVSSLDIIPTLSNLLGLEYDSRLLMGVDAFSDQDPIIIFENRSFISREGSYNAKTKEYFPNPGFDHDEEYRKKISNLINAKFYYSARILETDYYSKVLDR